MQSGVRGYIRRMTGQFLASRCTLQVETSTRGSFGQNDTTWSDVAVDLPCRVLPAGQSDTERVMDFAGQESISDIRRLVVPHDAALDVGQRAVIGSATYYVAALLVGVTDEAFRAAVVVRRAGADPSP